MNKKLRNLGWLMVAGLLGAALVAPSAAFAAHTVDLGESGTDQSGECTGDYFKIESTDDLEEGTHTYTGTTKDGAAFSANLTVTLDGDNEVDTIVVNWTTPPTVWFVIKAGDDFSSGSGTTLNADKAISNVAFCLGEETTTTTSEEETTTTSEETTTTSEETTTTTFEEETTTTSEETTESTDTETTSTGTEAEKTPPSTDSISQGSPSGVSSALLLVFAGLLALALIVPAKARSRR